MNFKSILLLDPAYPKYPLVQPVIVDVRGGPQHTWLGDPVWAAPSQSHSTALRALCERMALS